MTARIFVIVLSIVIIGAAGAYAQDFTIDKFHADIDVNTDSFFIVKETIDVQFHRPKHGIYREIPFRYKDDLGNSFTTPMEVLSVTDASGKKLGTKVESRGNVLYIRIGDASRYVDGRQTYVISYRVLENAILFFDDHDELYWNVTGNYWKAPIKEASANVVLFTRDKSTNTWASCYTGILGSRESECRYETSSGGAQFFAERPLRTGEGFTIAFGWDKGLVHPPSSLTVFLRALKGNWFFILPFISLAVMVRQWRERGRDPKVRESVAVMYQPPVFKGKAISPAEVGVLIDERVDSRDITSTIVGLAVKGYIRIEETKKEGLVFDSSDYYLAKTKEPDPELSLFETELMKNVFSGAASGILVSDLKNKFYVHLDSLKKTLYGELVGKKYFLKSPDKVRSFYMGMAVLAVAVAFPVAFSVTYLLFSSTVSDSAVWAKCVFSGLITGVPVLLFARIMPAKTKTGASAYMDIVGFQEFLNRAEKDRLQRMGDKDLFSRFLPYAIALDVADNWAKAFEGIYQEAPEWYVSQRGFRTFDSRSFSHSINSMSSSLGSAMFSAPRGSGISSGGGGGFGGGGSSGGGFGGGGGGSW